MNFVKYEPTSFGEVLQAKDAQVFRQLVGESGKTMKSIFRKPKVNALRWADRILRCLQLQACVGETDAVLERQLNGVPIEVDNREQVSVIDIAVSPCVNQCVGG